MKKISLVEVTLGELHGQEPVGGTEVTLKGIRYQILQVKSAKARSTKWRKMKREEEPEQKWQLLVEVVETSS